MSQTNSALMSIITQYTKQFVDRISELENENRQLKQKIGVVPSSFKAEFDRLTERHSELKISYAEIERENLKLRQDMKQLIAQQSSIESDVAKHFQQVFSAFGNKQFEQTPYKTHYIELPSVAPSQKQNHKDAKTKEKAKATTKLLNTEYESDSDSSDTDDEMPGLISDSDIEHFAPRKLRFEVLAGQDQNKSFVQPTQQTIPEPVKLNLSEILPQDDDSDNEKDEYEKILKQIITEGLMNGLENINRNSPNTTPFNFSQPDSRESRTASASAAAGGKRNRNSSSIKKYRPYGYVPLSRQNAKVKTSKTENPEPEQDTSNFQFKFMFPPQNSDNNQGFRFGLGNEKQTPTGPNGSSSTPKQNHTQQEAQLVQKILESIFTPNK
jgi:hypothetical protein